MACAGSEMNRSMRQHLSKRCEIVAACSHFFDFEAAALEHFFKPVARKAIEIVRLQMDRPALRRRQHQSSPTTQNAIHFEQRREWSWHMFQHTGADNCVE